MKKSGYALLVIILALTMFTSGCGAGSKPANPDEPAASGNAIPSPSDAQGAKPSVEPSSGELPADPSAAASAEPSSTPVSEPSPDTPSTPSPNQEADDGKDYSALGFSLLETDCLGLIKLRLTESELIYLLDEPESRSETEIWGADGLSHSVWSYPSKGLDIGMAQLPDDTEAFVFSVSATAPCTLATARGIAIGTPKDDVLSAYKDEIDPEINEDTDTWITAGSVYGGIGFAIEDGAVTYIFLGASAE